MPDDLKSRIRRALAESGSSPDEDILEELTAHAAAAYDTARVEGADEDDAERRVAELISSWRSDATRLHRRRTRAAALTPPPAASPSLTGLMHDAAYGMRLLRRRPGFFLLAALTLALGIAASVTIFSVTYGVLMKPLPWVEADRLVRLSESRKGHDPRIRGTITNGTYIAWHAQHTTIEEIAGWTTAPTTAVFLGGGEAMRLQVASVTPSLFTVLKAAPFRGRVLIEDDGPAGSSFVAKDVIVLSYGLWQEQFGGRDAAVGTVVQVGGKPTTVVGVMPKGFAFPDRATRAWTPRAVGSVIGEQGSRRISIFSALARLRPGVTPAQAGAEGTARARSAPDPGLAAVAMFGGNGPPEITVVPAIDMMTADVKPALMVLLGAVLLLLLTATANVASLQLARATARRREMAIRAAIGAGIGRLTRQLVIESSLVGLSGGAAGLIVATAIHRVLPSVLPSDFPRVDDVNIDARVMLFTCGVTVLASIVCGVLPALHTRRLNLVEALSDDAGAPVGIGLKSPTARARTFIMVGQLAVSCVLLVGAVLLGRSFIAMLHADRGYDPRNLLTARISLPAGFTIERRTQLLDGVVTRLRAMPGVTHVGFGNALPLLTSGGFRAFKMRPPADPSLEVDVNAIQRVVSPEYFGALGLRVVAGRPLAASDTMTSQSVIVVNRSFAAKYLGTAPLGAVVPNLGMCRDDDDRWQVVGVVADMRQSGIGEPPQPEIFLPYHQVGCAAAVPDPIVVIRASDDPSRYVSALRAVVREQAPLAALDSVMTMDDRVTTSLAKPRLYALVLSGFGVFALAIAGVGLFGVLSYTVALRAREIGVRAALGARPADIVTLVLRQVFTIAFAGIALGLTGAFGGGKLLGRVLYGVNQHDLPTFIGVALVLVVVSLIACVVPARRAASIDPLKVLRAG